MKKQHIKTNNETLNLNKTNQVDNIVDNAIDIDINDNSSATNNTFDQKYTNLKEDQADFTESNKDSLMNINLKQLAKRSCDSKRVKNGKKPKPFYQRMVPMVVLMIVAVISGAILGTWYFDYTQIDIDYGQYKEEELRDDTYAVIGSAIGKSNPSDSEVKNWVEIAKSNGITPAMLTASQNVILAEYNLSDINRTKTYEAIGTGKVDTIAKQTIFSSKRFDGEAYATESISKGLISLADYAYHKKGSNKVSLIKGTNITATSANWAGKRSDYTKAEYKQLNGVMPYEAGPYIISSQTVLEDNVEYTESVGENGKKLYTFTFMLDPIKSVLNYIYQVKMSSGLNGFPAFDDIQITYTIDEDWNLVQTDILEHYTVVYGIPAPCTATLLTKFTINQPVELPVKL